MKRLTHADERALRLMQSRLERAHVPLPQRDDKRNTLPVFIQSEPIECTIFGISPELTGCFLSVECATDFASGVYFESAYAELLSADLRFELLPKPKRGGPAYRFPHDAHVFEPAVVINKHFPGTLYPARPWDGLFLGVAFHPLALSLKGRLAIRLALCGTHGREASAELTAWVDPTGYLVPAATRHGTLFERDPADSDPEEVSPNLSK